MKYDFQTLSPADFEDLARDLIGADLGIKFEGFGPGPDQGIDGRHAAGSEETILQAKHYVGSTFASLKSAMKKERKSIEKLAPNRYLLVTSQVLTSKKKEQLAEIIGNHLQSKGDIVGQTELNSALRRNRDVERAHIKLWLSSAVVLDRFLRSAAFKYTAASRDEILGKLLVYAPNASFSNARDILEERKVLIVSGAPGVGKTTLAEMLVYAYVGEDWEFAAIRNIDDGFAEIETTKRQIFLFDDFLGKISLDRNAMAASESRFAKFVRLIRKSKNARFVLTTRAYIFEEARRVSEVIGDRRLDMSKYVLDVGEYTRRVRARIFFNHLSASTLSSHYSLALIDGDALPKIVDHKNYNPRIIEWMTDFHLLHGVPPESYAEQFIDTLDHPTDIWDRAFREHIPLMAQHLLICLFFGNVHGEIQSSLRHQYEAAHRALSDKHNVATRPTDFEDSLKLLEGSFVSLRNKIVSFINPSVRDYLHQYLDDSVLLADLADTARTGKWARSVWDHYKRLGEDNVVGRDVFAARFLNIGNVLRSASVCRRRLRDLRIVVYDELGIVSRCYFLAELKVASDNNGFADHLEAVIANPPGSLSLDYEGPKIPELIEEFRSGDYSEFPNAHEMADQLERLLIELMESGGSGVDEMQRIIEECDVRRQTLSQAVVDALIDAINHEIHESSFEFYEEDSKYSIEEYLSTIEELADWAGVDASSVLADGDERLIELREEEPEYRSPSFPTRQTRESEDFDDAALKSMFSTLAE